MTDLDLISMDAFVEAIKRRTKAFALVAMDTDDTMTLYYNGNIHILAGLVEGARTQVRKLLIQVFDEE